MKQMTQNGLTSFAEIQILLALSRTTYTGLPDPAALIPPSSLDAAAIQLDAAWMQPPSSLDAAIRHPAWMQQPEDLTDAYRPDSKYDGGVFPL